MDWQNLIIILSRNTNKTLKTGEGSTIFEIKKRMLNFRKCEMQVIKEGPLQIRLYGLKLFGDIEKTLLFWTFKKIQFVDWFVTFTFNVNHFVEFQVCEVASMTTFLLDFEMRFFSSALYLSSSVITKSDWFVV